MRELREIRLRRGLSQADLSALTGVAEFTISEIESGKRANPRPSTLRKLAQALEVEVADLYGEPAVPLAEAPREAGQPETPTRTIEEFERALAYVMEPADEEALKEQQAANRFLSSQGQNQDRVVDPPEAEVGRRFLEAFSPEERPLAFAEVTLGRARFRRDNATLEQSNADLRKLLRERGERIAQLEEENAHLREEREREAAR